MSKSKEYTFTQHPYKNSIASRTSSKANSKCSNVANSCFNEDAFVIARLKVSSKDLDSIIIPSLTVLVKDAHIYGHNSLLALLLFLLNHMYKSHKHQPHVGEREA